MKRLSFLLMAINADSDDLADSRYVMGRIVNHLANSPAIDQAIAIYTLARLGDSAATADDLVKYNCAF